MTSGRHHTPPQLDPGSACHEGAVVSSTEPGASAASEKTEMIVVLCLAFFLSGAAALIFETVWFRQQGLMLGNTVWASSLVLASFMAGLALGNGLAARYGAQLRRPLRVYAGLEVLIGLSGITLVLFIPVLTELVIPLVKHVIGSGPLLNASRLGTAFLLMLLPAAAMGATLPVMVGALSGREHDFGRVLGRLYGWNTLGAVAGALGGEMFLIERLGLRGAGLAAASMNGAAALAAMLWSGAGGAAVRNTSVDSERLRITGPGRRILVAAFLSGGIVLALEVVWFRFLLLFVFGTSRVFAVMLAVVLVGISAGGLVASWWLKRQPDAARFLPLIALAAGLGTAGTYIGFAEVMAGVQGTSRHDLRRLFLLATTLMGPVTLLSGLLFTLLGKALAAEVGEETRTAGLLTLANTVGAAAGAAVGGFLLLPYLGMEASFFGLSLAYGLVAAFIPRWPSPALDERRRESVALLLAVAVWAGVIVFFPFGLLRNHYIRSVAGLFAAEGSKLVVVREALTETILWLRRDLWGRPLDHRLVTNSFSMSQSGTEGKRYMSLYVFLPIAVNPGSRRALLISYGLGTTAKALTDTRTLALIDVVDVSRDILEVSRLRFPPGRSPLDDSRVRVHIEDGRFFLLTSDDRYDLITGEPPPPKAAGIVSLYSREYFHLVHRRLAPGGVVTYWLPVYQLSLPETLSVIRGFCDVFADCTVWTGAGGEWMLAGMREGAGSPPDEEAFTRQWRDPAVRPTLEVVGLETPEQLGALFLGDAPLLRQLTREAHALVDDHPARISPRIPVPFEPAYARLMVAADARRRFEQSGWIARWWPPALRARTLPMFEHQDALNRHFMAWSRPRPGLADVHRWLTASPHRAAPMWVLGSSLERQEIARDALRRGVADPQVHAELGIGAIVAGDPAAAERLLGRAAASGGSQDDLRLRVYASCRSGDRGRAAELMGTAATPHGEWARAEWTWVASWCGLQDPLAASAARPSPPAGGRAEPASAPGR